MTTKEAASATTKEAGAQTTKEAAARISAAAKADAGVDVADVDAVEATESGACHR